MRFCSNQVCRSLRPQRSGLPVLCLVGILALAGICAGWAQDPDSPPFEVELSGNRSVPSRVLRRVIRRPEFQRYTVFLVTDLEEALEDAYRSQGYADVKVEGVDEADGEKRRIRLEIEEGPRYRVGEVIIEGHSAFRAKELAVLLRQYPRRPRPAYDQRSVERDRRALEHHYLAQGYLKVALQSSEAFDREAGAVTLRHRIREGAQYRLAEMTFSGNRFFSISDLAVASGLQTGVPFAPARARAAQVRLLELYQDAGFAYARVEYEPSVDDETREVTLKFKVTEGTRVWITGIALKGHRRTRPSIIWREVELAEGQPYSRRALFESRRQIFSTGLFSSVLVEPASPLTGEATTEITIQVEEAKPVRLGLGVGYGTEERERFSLEAAYQNLFGRGQEIGFSGSLTGIGDYEEVYHRIPRLFGSRIEARSQLYHELKEEPSFTVDRWGGRIQLQRKFGSDGLLRWEYALEDLALEDVARSPSLEEFRKNEGVISKGGVSVLWDQRDVPLHPHSGFFCSADVTLGGGPLGGDFSFVKTELSGSVFYPVSSRTTLALAVRGGWLGAYGASDHSPLSERFLAGGADTLRGFERNKVGPRNDSGEFIGGDALFLFKSEYRFPIYRNFYGALFYDRGNVWPDLNDFDFTDMRESVGAGIHFISPVGAIRLEYGHVLDRQPGEPSGQFHLAAGYAF